MVTKDGKCETECGGCTKRRPHTKPIRIRGVTEYRSLEFDLYMTSQHSNFAELIVRLLIQQHVNNYSPHLLEYLTLLLYCESLDGGAYFLQNVSMNVSLKTGRVYVKLINVIFQRS